MELQSVLLTTGASVSFFSLINRGFGQLHIPETAQRNVWKWRNISTSFVHSLITGIWAVLCFYMHPQMAEDLIETHSVFSHALVCVSIGYFIYDFFDMVFNQKINHSWELLFHHMVVISCFGLSVLTFRYVGFAVVALLVEINSIFLHMRQILRMAGISKSTAYRVNSMINLGTYVVFRINTLAWMTRWLVLNRDLIPLFSYTVGSVGLAIMTLMNIVLFYRLLRTDFLKSSREKERPQVRMDRSVLTRQVESVERSIIFLRQEQLTLLHGLHLEILSLQKRCTELTHELNLKPPVKSEAEVLEEEELLEARCQAVESRLQDEVHSQEELRDELSHKGMLVGALRASLKEKERRFLDELKQRSHRSTALNSELQKQTKTAAYLSFQLHAARQKLQQQQQQQQQQDRRYQEMAGTENPYFFNLSQPDNFTTPTVKPKRRSGVRACSHLRAERARECVPREKVTGPEEPMAMPDPALFLHPRRLQTARPFQHHTQTLQGAEGGVEPDETDQEDPASRLLATVPVTAAIAKSKAK
ncbi:TLC domain-containing protein 2 [Bagarius yarrelli]|uniref:TLC domain-containing protein 2 n=1 Tax=Bagarius yarrelli TaxID=175774 RepID=A0A556U6W7_BAGYA|nr:TLC domain-containing protein 2 [Bagarius yarrelli]